MGGDFYDLGVGGVGGVGTGAGVGDNGDTDGAGRGPLGFQPLAEVDDAAGRTWAAEWVAAVVEGEQVKVDAARRERIWAAVGSLAAAPREERTLSGLFNLLQDHEAKEALRPFCVGGPFGGLFDADPLQLNDAGHLAG